MKITNVHGLPAPLYKTICWAVEQYEGPRCVELLTAKRISVTTLVNPPRISFLRAVFDDRLSTDAADLLYLVQGIAFHEIMAKAARDAGVSDLVEHRMTTTFDGWSLSGQADLTSGRQAALVLSDWKWTSVWSVISPRFEWDAQLNLYRWLYQRTQGDDPDALEDWALLRDWSASKAQRDSRLPPIAFARLERPMWTKEVTEAYLHDRLDLYSKARETVLSTNNPNAVLVCSAEERWERGKGPVRCTQYCDVARFCAFGAGRKGEEPEK